MTIFLEADTPRDSSGHPEIMYFQQRHHKSIDGITESILQGIETDA
jgi:hypothetical protein